jgi:aminoglycoside phosphotransferase (APT) family kinase protein
MNDLTAILLERGLIRSSAAKITALAGGVSCDIYLIEDGDNRFVLKRALPKLRVKDDWYADVNRNKHEQDYIDYVSAFLPEAMPRILHRAPEHGFFTMEYLGGEFQNWKTMLLAGTHEMKHAEEAGRILGTIHRQSWNDPVARERFQTGKNFYDLRIEPYLITTGLRNQPHRSIFEAEARRLAATNLCLVHGDYSPKNMLISPSRMVVLDCEVAWFGDPAFDVAFLLNHLVLKASFFAHRHRVLLQMADAAWMSYVGMLTTAQREHVEVAAPRLLLMLMLARIDGKSPVEYLQDGAKAAVRWWVGGMMCGECPPMQDLLKTWSRLLDQLPA